MNASDVLWAGGLGTGNEVEEIPANLPAEPNSFVGRARELGDLRDLVGAARAVTLCGAGGIGKTRLALRVMATVAADFPDGTVVVELADLRQPDLVMPRVAARIGIGEEPGRPLLDTLADALRPRQMLLLLDNCEHLVSACAQLCQQLLACSPGLRVLATSREPLRVAAETVYQVPPLPVGPADGPASEAWRYEAIALFADRAAAALPGFAVGPGNAAAAAALCRRLDGMPLAIELAAVWVRTLSLEQITERLADRFSLLTSGDRTAAARHRTLRATIDWSHDLLTPAEQVLLRRLSVFAGWSLEMAEEICAGPDMPASRVLDLLAALVDKSLVVREREVLGQARYRLLDTIREYAAERLAEAGETAACQRRLRDYTVRVAEHNLAIGMARVAAPWSARVDVFRRYDVEAGNLLQVLSQCRAEGDAETGMRICTAIRPCWLVRGTFTGGAEWLDAFLAMAEAVVPPQVRGAALVGRAQLALPNDPVLSKSLAEAGLAQCRAAGDEFWTAAGLNLLSEIALQTGRIDDAAAYADEAMSVAVAAGDGWDEGYALGIRSAIAAVHGKLREAQQLAKASISVMQRIDQQWGTARALLGLGDLARLRGDASDAHRRYLAALTILREVGARPEIARCLAGLGRVAMDLGAAGLARQHLAESLRLSHATGSRIAVARGVEAFAALAVLENQPEQAVRLTGAATALRDTAGLPALPGARAERYLAAGRRLGEPIFTRLWTEGLAMTGDEAVTLALAGPGDGNGSVSLAAVTTDEPAPAVRGALTARERQVVALLASGRSNKAIGEELYISPATAARHVANILAKLGFTSRTQVAAWAAATPADLATRVGPATPGRRAVSGGRS